MENLCGALFQDRPEVRLHHGEDEVAVAETVVGRGLGDDVAFAGRRVLLLAEETKDSQAEDAVLVEDVDE